MASTDRRLGLSGGVAFKAPCRVATTANITLNGLQTIDGVSLAQDDRVLVKNQSTASQNGIWIADSGDWTRAADFNGSRDVVQGTLVLVVSGTVSASTVYQLTTASPVIGTSSLAFAVTGTPALAYASAFIQTLLDDTTAAAARTTLGVPAIANVIATTLTAAGDILSHDGSVYTRIPLGSAGQVLGVSGSAVAWLSVWETGDYRISSRSTTSLAGWVKVDDGTIGSAGSGATTRANADTADLFAHLWNTFSNSLCPVSSGRGASAAADFAANKTITLSAMLGRALVVAGAGSGLTSRALGDTAGTETHTHTGTTGNENGGTFSAAAAGINVSNSPHGHAFTTDAGSSMQPSTFVNVFMKL